MENILSPRTVFVLFSVFAVCVILSPGFCGVYKGVATGETSIAVTDECAAEGRHSLKFADSPVADRPGQPYMYVKPNFLTEGRGFFSCDILLEADAAAGIHFRTQVNARQFPVGPVIMFRNGRIRASGKENIGSYTTGVWQHLSVTLHLDGSASYDVEIKSDDAPTRSLTGLPCQSPQFRKCGVIVIMSPGELPSAFFVDNIVVKTLD